MSVCHSYVGGGRTRGVLQILPSQLTRTHERDGIDENTYGRGGGDARIREAEQKIGGGHAYEPHEILIDIRVTDFTGHTPL